MIRNALLAAVAVLGLSVGSANAQSLAFTEGQVVGETVTFGASSIGLNGGLNWTTTDGSTNALATYGVTTIGDWWFSTTTGAGAADASTVTTGTTAGIRAGLGLGLTVVGVNGVVGSPAALGIDPVDGAFARTQVSLPYGVENGTRASANGLAQFDGLVVSQGLLTGGVTGGFGSVYNSADSTTVGAVTGGNTPFGSGGVGITATGGTATFVGVASNFSSGFAAGPGLASTYVTSNAVVSGSANVRR